MFLASSNLSARCNLSRRSGTSFRSCSRLRLKVCRFGKLRENCTFMRVKLDIMYFTSDLLAASCLWKKLKLQEGFYTADLWFLWDEEKYLKLKRGVHILELSRIIEVETKILSDQILVCMGPNELHQLPICFSWCLH